MIHLRYLAGFWIRFWNVQHFRYVFDVLSTSFYFFNLIFRSLEVSWFSEFSNRNGNLMSSYFRSHVVMLMNLLREVFRESSDVIETSEQYSLTASLCYWKVETAKRTKNRNGNMYLKTCLWSITRNCRKISAHFQRIEMWSFALVGPHYLFD